MRLVAHDRHDRQESLHFPASRLPRGNAPRVAIAFEVPMVGDLPCGEHDLAVMAIVTGESVIRPERFFTRPE